MNPSEQTDPPAQSPFAPHERPWLFALLIAPMAVVANGVAGGALSFILRRQGVDPSRAADIIPLMTVPATIYFLWSPITDFWIRRRSWIIAASTAAAVAMIVAFAQPVLASNWAVALMFFSVCLGQLVVSACGGMMGTLKSEANRRRASSFYQGGSLAFGALAVLVMVPLSEKLHLGVLGWIAAAMIALPSLAALAAPEQTVVKAQGLAETAARIWREFKITFLRWDAIPYTLCMVFPMASGAMIAWLPGLAADYHVNGQQVAWINGFGGAILTAAGALAVTLMPARSRAPVAYMLAGLVNAAVLAVLAFCPLSPIIYLAGTVLFLFTIGTAYALFTAVVLEFLGVSGKSGSTRYSIINSLGNIPVVYMQKIDGMAWARWGPRGAPAVDAILSIVGASILLAWFITRPRKPAE
jgi:PAT family beta-lactamase induction signal transducer AmpG